MHVEKRNATRKMATATLALLLALVGYIAPYSIVSAATAPSLGTAQSFTVLGAASVTNTGPTTISGGNLGVSPGTTITGFPPGIVTPPGAIHLGDAVALQAQSDVTTAYNNLTGQPCTNDLTGQDLGGKTLTPSVYCFSSSAQLTGTLTLDAQGNAGAVFIIKAGSTLTTASNSSVRVINGGSGCNVYWQIGSSATLSTGTALVGNVLALASITLNTSATLSGRAFARVGSVTLDSNSISSAACAMLAPTATVVVPTATQIPPTATQIAPTATQIAPTATQIVPAATQTAIAATQTVIAATQTVPAATQTTIAATQTVIAATQNVPTATPPAPAITQVATAVVRNTPVPTPIMRPNTVIPNGGSGNNGPANISAPYRIPPNGAPSSDIVPNSIPFPGIVPHNGQTPIALVGTPLSTPIVVGGAPTSTVAAGTVAATPSPASTTAVSAATSTRIATATVMIPARLPNTGGGGMATAFTRSADTQHDTDIALWLTLATFLTLMCVGLLHVRRARR